MDVHGQDAAMPGSFPSFPEDETIIEQATEETIQTEATSHTTTGVEGLYPDPPDAKLPQETLAPQAVNAKTLETTQTIPQDQYTSQHPQEYVHLHHQHLHKSGTQPSMNQFAQSPPFSQPPDSLPPQSYAQPPLPKHQPAYPPAQQRHHHPAYPPQPYQRQYREVPQIQVVTQAAEPKPQINVGEQMQMMMMNGMMMQQMQAQQMQAAQMAALTQQTFHNQNDKHGSGCKSQSSCGRERRDGRRGSVNIQTIQKKKDKLRPKIARTNPISNGVQHRIVNQPPPVIVQQGPAATIESVATDNWQKATILLCVAVVGVIYLVCSRAGEVGEKKESIAKKHMS